MNGRIVHQNFPAAVEMGAGSLETIAAYVPEKSRVALISVNILKEFGCRLQALLPGREIFTIEDILGEPSDQDIKALHSRLLPFNPDIIIGLGGGSVLDAAKILSVTLADPAIMDDFWNLAVGARSKKKLILIPTSAGTGAEATPNAIFLHTEKEMKIGIVNPLLIADAVILDASLTYSLPKEITASTGVDTLCHAVECFISKKANLSSDHFAVNAVKIVFESLPIVYTNPKDSFHRERMLIASFYGGLCIASSGTNIVHALSYPLGGKYHIPHGLANAVLLEEGMKFNEPACRSQFAVLGAAIGLQGDDESELSSAFIKALGNLMTFLKIPKTLGELNIPLSDITVLADLAFDVQRLLLNNPREVSKEDIQNIYRRLF